MEIIAEVGSNWNNLQDCLKSIEIAKSCGAKAVKFQLYTSRELYGRERKIKNELPRVWLKNLFNLAKRTEIEFMCTAFSPDGYRAIDSMVERHKIASAEITHLDILKQVNEFRKPVILSTGGAKIKQVDDALKILKDCKVTIMFCVADYPAKIIDFRYLTLLKEVFGNNYGYGFSDHSVDVLNIPIIAKNHKCDILEKHVNLTDQKDTPDAPHSLSQDEFKLMIDNIKDSTTVIDTESLANKSMKELWQRRKLKDEFGQTGFYRP